jgi:hypothetical protein
MQICRAIDRMLQHAGQCPVSEPQPGSEEGKGIKMKTNNTLVHVSIHSDIKMNIKNLCVTYSTILYSIQCPVDHWHSNRACSFPENPTKGLHRKPRAASKLPTCIALSAADICKKICERNP